MVRQQWDAGPSGLLLASDLARPAQERLGATIYQFGYEPAGSTYVDLLRVAQRFCAYATLVTQDFTWTDRAHEAIEHLKQWHLGDHEVQEWPGTRTEKSATLMVFKFDADIAGTLSGLTRRLYQWEQPVLPEDLCLFRPTGQPWLVSIAHERDGWLHLRLDEAEAVISALRPLPLRRFESER